MKLTERQKEIVFLANRGDLRQYRGTPDMYYHVSTKERRSGQYIVKRATINLLKNVGFITVDI